MKRGNIAFFIPHMGCPQNCSFCNQKTIAGVDEPVGASNMRAAVISASKNPALDLKNTEIAFFGGSFTAIDKDYMTRLLLEGKKLVDEFSLYGIRISTRPDAITPAILDTLRENGVKSIELGCQSMDDSVLCANLRGHSAQDVVEASGLIKSAGFSLGHQIMVGLFGDSKEKAIATARRLIALKPDTIRIYPTLVLEGTRLADLYRSGEYIPPTEEELISTCAHILEMFIEAEISVLRIGLHASESLNDGLVAGINHPAFGEICYSRLYLRLIKKALEGRGKGKYNIEIHKKDISKATGQKRENIKKLEKLGFYVKLCPSDEAGFYARLI